MPLSFFFFFLILEVRYTQESQPFQIDKRNIFQAEFWCVFIIRTPVPCENNGFLLVIAGARHCFCSVSEHPNPTRNKRYPVNGSLTWKQVTLITPRHLSSTALGHDLAKFIIYDNSNQQV